MLSNKKLIDMLLVTDCKYICFSPQWIVNKKIVLMSPNEKSMNKKVLFWTKVDIKKDIFTCCFFGLGYANNFTYFVRMTATNLAANNVIIVFRVGQ